MYCNLNLFSLIYKNISNPTDSEHLYSEQRDVETGSLRCIDQTCNAPPQFLRVCVKHDSIMRFWWTIATSSVLVVSQSTRCLSGKEAGCLFQRTRARFTLAFNWECTTGCIVTREARPVGGQISEHVHVFCLACQPIPPFH